MENEIVKQTDVCSQGTIHNSKNVMMGIIMTDNFLPVNKNESEIPIFTKNKIELNRLKKNAILLEKLTILKLIEKLGCSYSAELNDLMGISRKRFDKLFEEILNEGYISRLSMYNPTVKKRIELLKLDKVNTNTNYYSVQKNYQLETGNYLGNFLNEVSLPEEIEQNLKDRKGYLEGLKVKSNEKEKDLDKIIKVILEEYLNKLANTDTLYIIFGKSLNEMPGKAKLKRTIDLLRRLGYAKYGMHNRLVWCKPEIKNEKTNKEEETQ